MTNRTPERNRPLDAPGGRQNGATREREAMPRLGADRPAESNCGALRGIRGACRECKNAPPMAHKLGCATGYRLRSGDATGEQPA